MKTDNYKFEKSWWQMIKSVDTKTQGLLLLAINKYIFDREEPSDLPPLAQGVFIAIKVEYDTAREKQERKCEVLRENGRKGGLTKAQNFVANASNSSKCYQLLENLANASNCYKKTQISRACDINTIDNENNKEVVVVEHAQAHDEQSSGLQATTTSFNFLSWWDLFGTKEWDAQRNVCEKFWSTLNDQERERIMEHTKVFAEINKRRPIQKRKQPYFYLCMDKVWKNDMSTIVNNRGSELKSLTGIEQEQNWKNNIPMVQVKDSNGKFYILTTMAAKEHGMKVVKKWEKIE